VARRNNSNSNAKAKEGQNGWWYPILKLIPPDARVIALVALLSEAVVLGVIKLLPEPQRIYGFVVFACVLIAVLIGTVLVIRRSASKDHSQPNYGAKVERLTEKLVEDRFLPDLIVAIPRGGLVVAGHLARQLGEKKIVPVISLSHLDAPAGFNNPFNHLSFKRQDFQETPVKILIVDDVCISGRKLAEARTFIEDSIDHRDFEIKTAVISFSRSYPRAPWPSFFVDRETPTRDASGEYEEM
jgi:hypoxanthine phosphoribosyltransferase